MSPLLDERLVLGALVRGTLRPADVADVEWTAEHHARLADVLLAALEVHGRVQLELTLAVCTRLGVWPAGAVYEGRGRRYLVGYLPTLARRAPGRMQGLEAVRRLEVAAEERRVEAERTKRRSQSAEVRALEAALEAARAGKASEALARMQAAELAIVGVSRAELAELAAVPPAKTTAPQRRRGRAA